MPIESCIVFFVKKIRSQCEPVFSLAVAIVEFMQDALIYYYLPASQALQAVLDADYTYAYRDIAR